MVNKLYILTLALFVIGLSHATAQLSEGGTPRKISQLKKGIDTRVKMPPVNNELLRWEAQVDNQDSPLKPFVFARNFEVNYSPVQDGQWYRSEDGWWIWQMHIVSEGAYSISLLLRDFQPGRQDRIFVYTPDEENLLGAFTSRNHTSDQVFPISPLPGDEVVLQYETPVWDGYRVPFVIGIVSHDFMGILKSRDIRRPLDKVPGECIPDINCDVADRWRKVQNSACRIMVINTTNSELCSGTLLNNTAQNARPFILTANHCIDNQTKASASLFLFNYESPYCGPLDGDNTNSLSGSRLRATHDSLDFTLVELVTPPPPSFRPYFAGWNRSVVPADTVASIHHPQGDVKKIAIDNHAPAISTFNYTTKYTRNGFWRIGRWEYGATEDGSSGGGLFNTSNQLVGSLVGGSSECSYPMYDYFARFDIAWNNQADSTRQLKYWLDPQNSNAQSLGGKNFYTEDEFCMAFTNMTDGDDHNLLRLTSQSGTSEGYWTGTNSQKITEVGEKFSIPGNEDLYGVSLGIGKKVLKSANSTSRFRVNVYDIRGNNFDIIHTQLVNLKDLAADAMNLVVFNEPVLPADSFLIAINFEGIINGDTLAIYQSVRENSTRNSMFVRQDNAWSEFRRISPSGLSGALAMEVIACNVEGIAETPKSEIPLTLKLYPNPTFGRIEVSASDNITLDMMQVFNSQGRQVPFHSARLTPRKIEINLAGQSPGMYFIRVFDGKRQATGKAVLTH